jgi:Fe/S biogenesis protein NfuA
MDTVLVVSPEAVAMIDELRAAEPGDVEHALLVEITGFRGAQFSYELAFVPLEKEPGRHIEYHGALPVIIPEKDVEKLRSASLNLTDEGLAIENPNGPASPTMSAPKGDLTGPIADQVAQVLAEQVNPAIAMHGGAAELVSVDGTVVYLRLGGGCQGCGMAQVTLKQGIERILLDAIGELTAVVDVTDHEAGADPYYERSKK